MPPNGASGAFSPMVVATRHGRGGSFPRSVHAVRLRPAMTEKEKPLLRRSPYPDSYETRPAIRVKKRIYRANLLRRNSLNDIAKPHPAPAVPARQLQCP